MFCIKCGNLLLPSDGKMKCSCGYVQEDARIKDKKKKNNIIAVADKKSETLPEIKADCAKCKNDKAYFWTLQTRSSDEPETKFYRCTKCENVWREYS